MRYFAYGANCNPKVMERKGVAFASRKPATLPGFRMRFNKRSLRENLPEEIGFANIESSPDSVVEGVLYEIEEAHLGRLDESERFPDHYHRIDICVDVGPESMACFAYQAQPDKVADGLRPSRNYLNHILSAKDFLSLQYYEALDRSLTYEGECCSCGQAREVVFIREADALYSLCQPCREARLLWGDAHGRPLTVVETSQIMKRLVIGGEGYASVADLLHAARSNGLIVEQV